MASVPSCFRISISSLEVISKQKEAYTEIENLLTKSQNQLKGNLNNFLKHPLIDVNSILEQINNLFLNIIEALKKREAEHPDLMKQDNLRNRITSLFDNKVGHRYPIDKIKEIYEEGEKRYDKVIPPSFSDSTNKDGNEKYGDLILWFQMIDKAKEISKPIIFITDDSKDDWWWIFKGKTMGPRPELIEEFLLSSGQHFYMYSSDQFMEYARQYLKQHVEQKAIDEIKAVRNQYNKFLWHHKILKRKLYDNSVKIKDLHNEMEIYNSRMEQVENKMALLINKKENIHNLSGEEKESLDREFGQLENELKEIIDGYRDMSVRIKFFRDQKELITGKIAVLEKELKIKNRGQHSLIKKVEVKL